MKALGWIAGGAVALFALGAIGKRSEDEEAVAGGVGTIGGGSGGLGLPDAQVAAMEAAALQNNILGWLSVGRGLLDAGEELWDRVFGTGDVGFHGLPEGIEGPAEWGGPVDTSWTVNDAIETYQF